MRTGPHDDGADSGFVVGLAGCGQWVFVPGQHGRCHRRNDHRRRVRAFLQGGQQAVQQLHCTKVIDRSDQRGRLRLRAQTCAQHQTVQLAVAAFQSLRDDGFAALGCGQIAHDIGLAQIDTDDGVARSQQRLACGGTNAGG